MDDCILNKIKTSLSHGNNVSFQIILDWFFFAKPTIRFLLAIFHSFFFLIQLLMASAMAELNKINATILIIATVKNIAKRLEKVS
ncbi:hypothetical protein FD42_GL002363 [Lentilactobacillus hilgardii DSM 20176 = ATCC 8290]|uniref:Uncharacterized protein n=1 Tax=Lentilactobacillus hilgardii (strain ATCC 8290 / DSM 20176 / CCUG 30140 / JCM 1155 / KCTC 3500 / NBRC 15886 / NCIMB 8040 / NRRL B-1843 / 9) TaxID=1423757 RepID=C0XJ43_LENH9|nr:hypothetical protein HMPREF0519_1254 [Lentilactobacillus hilgardii DSM 20176 = ATCC 8290]KRK57309.1 hypothetical protein FD42_GL002363 [Lentilactobacillus hilgardii DSM 20176 = ATCC 8290]